jgi:hypothetical protein
VTRVGARAVTASVLVALAAVGACAPTAIASRADKKAIWGPVTVNGRSAFPMYRDLGVGIFQTGLNWAAVAPTRPHHARDPGDGAYRWPADLDYAIAQAARYRMRILLQVSRAPTWANGGRAENDPPRDVGDWARFMTAAARRYPSVHLWMIWGEPNGLPNNGSLVPAPHNALRLTPEQAAAPHRYARMLDASYGALKRVSRRNLVIGGNTFSGGDIPSRLWIRNLQLPGGRAPRMDLYGHNPFSARAPNLANPAMDPSVGKPAWIVDFSDLGRLSRLVDTKLARGHKIRLFLSEWMIPTGVDSELNFHTTRAVQARWIRAGWRIVRRSSFIYALGWIHLFDDPPGGSMSGLLDAEGRPKPGYFAFRAG